MYDGIIESLDSVTRVSSFIAKNYIFYIKSGSHNVYSCFNLHFCLMFIIKGYRKVENCLVKVFNSVQHLFIMTVLFVSNWPTDKEQEGDCC